MHGGCFCCDNPITYINGADRCKKPTLNTASYQQSHPEKLKARKNLREEQADIHHGDDPGCPCILPRRAVRQDGERRGRDAAWRFWRGREADRHAEQAQEVPGQRGGGTSPMPRKENMCMSG